MAFHEPRKSKSPQLACACCGAEAATGPWGTPLCEHHWALWAEQAPSSGEIAEQATPDEIEAVHKYEYLPPDIVLKPDALERRYREWMATWIKAQRHLKVVSP